MINSDKILWTDSALIDIAEGIKNKELYTDNISSANDEDDAVLADDQSPGAVFSDPLSGVDLSIGVPWPITLSPLSGTRYGTYYTAADGTGLINVTLTFDDVVGAQDYEVRFSKVSD